MSTATTPLPAAIASTRTHGWKTAVALSGFAVVAIVVFAVMAPSEAVTWSFSATGSIQLPPLTFDARIGGSVVSLVAVAIAADSVARTVKDQRTPRWMLAVFGVAIAVGFLIVSSAGHTLPITGLLAGSLALSVPLILGALGGVISERVGVVNVAIEGQMLGGAFVSALVASATGSLIVGLLAAMVAGALVSATLAIFSIRYYVDQVIVGIVLNVLVLGLTNFLYSSVMATTPSLNAPPQFQPFPLPLLGAIPVIGPVLFDQTIVVYLMYVAVLAVFVGLFFTRWGLRLRAVGEHPEAADTVGILVNPTRFWNVSLAGAIAGLGGAYFTLGSVGAFSLNITSGAGYIGLAAVIFGRWDPIRTTLAALLFGFASNLQNVLGILGSPIPSDFLLMLPYLITIVSVAGLVGHVRGPAAAGKPYITR